MACERPSPITTFEQDVPSVTFYVTADGAPLRLHNYSAELHVVDPEGKGVAVFGLQTIKDGELSLTIREGQTLGEYYEMLATFEVDVSYSAQIFLRSDPPAITDIMLYDIVDPYWLNYIPPTDPPTYDHVPGWGSGEVRLDQTIPTEFPFDVREAYKLREAPNG